MTDRLWELKSKTGLDHCILYGNTLKHCAKLHRLKQQRCELHQKILLINIRMKNMKNNQTCVSRQAASVDKCISIRLHVLQIAKSALSHIHLVCLQKHGTAPLTATDTGAEQPILGQPILGLVLQHLLCVFPLHQYTGIYYLLG